MIGIAVYREILFFKNGHMAFEVKLYRGEQITAPASDTWHDRLLTVLPGTHRNENTEWSQKNGKNPAMSIVLQSPPAPTLFVF